MLKVFIQVHRSQKEDDRNLIKSQKTSTSRDLPNGFEIFFDFNTVVRGQKRVRKHEKNQN
jgi:hypothetical protein